MNALKLTVLGVIISISIFGQETHKINYQISFGTSISIPYKKQIDFFPEINGSPIINSKSDFGYFVEFDFLYNMNNQISMNTGVSFIDNSLKVKGATGVIETEGAIQTKYLGIPLEFNYQVFKNIPLKTGFGIYFNLMLMSKEKGTVYIDTAALIEGAQDPNDPLLESIEPVQDYEIDNDKNYKHFDFGLTAKIEYELIRAEKFSIIILSKFCYGLTNINERPKVHEWKNYSLLFGLGVKI